MRYALINENIVVNVVEQDTTPSIEGHWVACNDAGPGWLYDGSMFFPPVVTVKNINKTALLARFTDQEFVNILNAAKTDVEVEAWKYRFDSASEINLDSDRTKAGFALLVSKALLTQTRANVILSNPVQSEERP